MRNVYRLLLFVAVIATTGVASGGRTNKMFDVSQFADPTWGQNWCAPTAVGNSFAWLAKEYPGLAGLSKVNGTGDPLSAKDIVNILGKVDMNTNPNSGTGPAAIEAGKKSYISRHGLGGAIKVETKQWPTKKWIKDQYDAGQDVEFGFGYYELVGGKWTRNGGHVMVYGDVPGIDANGHALSLADVFDPASSDDDSDYQLAFTDPGRDDLLGDYGCIAASQYSLTDASGQSYFCTASTYNVLWEPNLFGTGEGGYLLEGYQGAGDFGRADAPARTKCSILEYAWAESPVPEPSVLTVLLLGGSTLVVGRLCRRCVRRGKGREEADKRP
jgi:hypothetical protein